MLDRHEILACPCGAVAPDMGLMKARGTWKVICIRCGRRGAPGRLKIDARERWNMAVEGHARFAYEAIKEEGKD